MEKIAEKGCHEKKEDITGKEDAMLKVLESMLKKIEELDRTAKKTTHQHQYQTSEGKIFRHPLQEL